MKESIEKMKSGTNFQELERRNKEIILNPKGLPLQIGIKRNVSKMVKYTEATIKECDKKLVRQFGVK